MFFGGDPFEHFAHGGGGSRRSGMGRPSADVDTTKLYETLGVRIYCRGLRGIGKVNAVIFGV